MDRSPAVFDPAEVADALRAFVGLLEDPDPKARAFGYTEDAVFLMAGSAPVEGRATMLAGNTGTLRDVVLEPERIEGAGGLASAYGRFRAELRAPDGGSGPVVSMRFLMVLRKEPDGVWRVAQECLLPDVSG